MKNTVLTAGIVIFLCLASAAKAQTGATSAKNTTDKSGKQCSSVGYGSDKQKAESNREKAEKGAREKGHDSFSGKEGGGAAGCKDKDGPSKATKE
jgi:hypothetical protein